MSIPFQTPPADLPPDIMIPFSAFDSYFPGTTRKWIETAAQDGRFVPGVRLSPRKVMVFRAGAVAGWLADRAAGLDVKVTPIEETMVISAEQVRAMVRATTGGVPLKAVSQ